MPRNINDEDPKHPWLPLIITLGIGVFLAVLFVLDLTHPLGVSS